MQKNTTSYAVKVELSFKDNLGHTNNYNETIVVCTNILDARSVEKSVKNSFIVQASA